MAQHTWQGFLSLPAAWDPRANLGWVREPWGNRARGQAGRPLGATYPPGANSRDTQLSMSLRTVGAQCRMRGPPDLWCRPTAWPWSSPSVVSLSLLISQMGPWSPRERQLGMGMEWGDPSGGGASPVPTLLLPRPPPAAAPTAGRQAAVLPGEGVVLHHVAPGPLVLVWVPGGQGREGGRGSWPRRGKVGRWGHLLGGSRPAQQLLLLQKVLSSSPRLRSLGGLPSRGVRAVGTVLTGSRRGGPGPGGPRRPQSPRAAPGRAGRSSRPGS